MANKKDKARKEEGEEKAKEEEEPSFEIVLEKLGALGKFQLIQVTFCYLSMLVTSSVVLSFVFEGYKPPHICNAVNETRLLSTYGLQNDSSAEVVYEPCEIKIFSNQTGDVKEVEAMSCPNGRNFFDAKETTFLSDWDLVCESRGVAELSQTCFNVGQLIGALIGTFLADRFGRRPVFIGSSFLLTAVEWCIVAAPNIFVVYGLKLASGTFYQALVCCFFVYALEFITPRHREANGVIMCSVFVLGTLLVGTIGYFFRNDSWRYFQGGIGVNGLFCLAYPFVLYESPRWLAATGKTKEALRILEKASIVNGTDFKEVEQAFVTYANHALHTEDLSLPMIGDNENYETAGPDVVTKSAKNDADQERKRNILDLFRSKSLRKSTLITFYLFVTNIMTYFGLYMTSSNVAGNRFLNFTLLNLVELPCNVCVYYMMKKMHRRLVLMIFLGLTAVSLMTSTLLDTLAKNLKGSDAASTALFIFGKFFISGSFNVIYILAPEIFPTNLRSTAIGVCGGLARIGGMAAPFMRPLYDIVKWGPGVIFTVMCLVAVVVTPMLPESKDANLPETIDEMGKKEKN